MDTMTGLRTRRRRIWAFNLVTVLATGGALLFNGGVAAANDAGTCLFGPPGPGALCIGADLHGVQLPGADLTGADLTGADLTGADLTGATLTGAQLAGADLTGATLAGATLRGAVLVSADLDATDLSHVDLTAADLTGATWNGATLTGTSLPPPPSSGLAALFTGGTTSVSGSTTATVLGSTVGQALAGGPQATFRLCAAPAPDTDRAIEQFLAGAGFGATLTGRAAGCADQTVTRTTGGSSAGRQNTDLRMSSGAAGGGWIVVRISSENGTTRVTSGA
jgi:hypothetical protein